MVWRILFMKCSRIGSPGGEETKEIKKWSCSTSNFIVLIATRLIRQMLAIFTGVAFCMKVQEKTKKVVVLCSTWN